MAETKLVKALVGLPGLSPGNVGELPSKLADMAIRKGYAVTVDKLSDRLGPETVLGVAGDPGAEAKIGPATNKPRIQQGATLKLGETGTLTEGTKD